MKDNTVLLLTNKFPYGIVETFIEAELECVPEDVTLIVIPTQGHELNDKGRKVPPNIKVDDFLTRRPKYEYLMKSLEMLFSKEYRDEIRGRKAKGSISLTERIHLIGYYGRAKQIADNLISKYRKNGVVFYSYWATEAALAEKYAKLRMDCKCVTRAHRTDVYEGQCVYNTVPSQGSAIAGIDKVYVCSKSGQEYLQNKYPESREKIDYAYLGTRDYGFRQIDNSSDEFVIASCSRLVPVKRVHLIAEALKQIGNRKIHWIHIGDGSERGKIEEIISTMPKNVRVTLEGNMDHDNVMEYYRDHDINLFINVSKSEGLPVSIMEVMSYGIPVIATNVGGTSEIVNASTGNLIPEDFKIEDLLRCIDGYADMDFPSTCELRQSIRNFWEQNYSASTNYRLFYSRLIQK